MVSLSNHGRTPLRGTLGERIVAIIPNDLNHYSSAAASAEILLTG